LRHIKINEKLGGMRKLKLDGEKVGAKFRRSEEKNRKGSRRMNS